jgi:hypothetical protein
MFLIFFETFFMLRQLISHLLKRPSTGPASQRLLISSLSALSISNSHLICPLFIGLKSHFAIVKNLPSQILTNVGKERKKCQNPELNSKIKIFFYCWFTIKL